MLKKCWRCVAWSSLMKPSENGASSSVRPTLTICAEELRGQANGGISTKCFSRSMDAFTTCGVQLIRMEMFWTSLVQSNRDKKAAKKFFRKLLKDLKYVPRVIVTDKLRSYSAAKAEGLPSVEHQQQKYGNNRAENSHQPTRLRERLMRRFKSPGHAQRFLSVFGIFGSHFRVGRHLYRATGYRAVMKSRFTLWEVAIGVGNDD